MTDRCCGFTWDHYREILSAAQDSDYSFLRFDEPLDVGRPLLLRHDVDISPEHALRLGEIEASMGAVASYFFQVNTPMYNVFHGETREAIWKLSELGHSIGIHLDADLVRAGDPSLDQLQEVLWSLHALMSKHLPIQRTFSIHRPPEFVLNHSFDGFISVYERRFFSDIAYVSDSRRVWRKGCPCEALREGRWESVQLLIHPCWWNEEELDYRQLAEVFLQSQRSHAIEYLRANISPLADVLDAPR